MLVQRDNCCFYKISRPRARTLDLPRRVPRSVATAPVTVPWRFSEKKCGVKCSRSRNGIVALSPAVAAPVGHRHGGSPGGTLAENMNVYVATLSMSFLHGTHGSRGHRLFFFVQAAVRGNAAGMADPNWRRSPPSSGTGDGSGGATNGWKNGSSPPSFPPPGQPIQVPNSRPACFVVSLP